ncbi:MAG: ATP-binding cassette domain-containing protein, partial [Bdellovibrionota bacterium]
LAGIIHPDRGEVRILGHQPWKRSIEFRKSIALVMGQKAQLWWDLPAADCFLLLREIYQVPPAQFAADLDELVSALDVRNQLKTPIRRLSLGERMKMELIAALLHRPKVFFLDEPTIGLDLSAQRAIRQFLLDYRKARHPAMIITSHYMADIESLCERIVIIRDGQFLYDGRIERILEDFRVARKQALAKTDNQPDEESNTVELEIVIEAILKKEFL